MPFVSPRWSINSQQPTLLRYIHYDLIIHFFNLQFWVENWPTTLSQFSLHIQWLAKKLDWDSQFGRGQFQRAIKNRSLLVFVGKSLHKSVRNLIFFHDLEEIYNSLVVAIEFWSRQRVFEVHRCKTSLRSFKNLSKIEFFSFCLPRALKVSQTSYIWHCLIQKISVRDFFVRFRRLMTCWKAKESAYLEKKTNRGAI